MLKFKLGCYTITPPLRPRQSQNKVHRNIRPRNRKNRKGHIQTMWIQSRLSLLTRCASSNKALNIKPHPRPKEVCVDSTASVFLAPKWPIKPPPCASCNNKRRTEPTEMQRWLDRNKYIHHLAQNYSIYSPLCNLISHL